MRAQRAARRLHPQAPRSPRRRGRRDVGPAKGRARPCRGGTATPPPRDGTPRGRRPRRGSHSRGAGGGVAPRKASSGRAPVHPRGRALFAPPRRARHLRRHPAPARRACRREDARGARGFRRARRPGSSRTSRGGLPSSRGCAPLRLSRASRPPSPPFSALPGTLRDRTYAFAPSAARSPAARVVFWEDASERLPPGNAGRRTRRPGDGLLLRVALAASRERPPHVHGARRLRREPAGLGSEAPRGGRAPCGFVDALRARLREN